MQLNNLKKEDAKTLAITLNFHESLDSLSFKDANDLWKTAGFSGAKGWTALKGAMEAEYNNNTSDYEDVENMDSLSEELRDIVKELSSDNRNKGFSNRDEDTETRGGGFGGDSFGFGNGEDRRSRDRDDDRRSNRRGDRRKTRSRRGRDSYDTEWTPRDRRRDDNRDDDRDRDSFTLTRAKSRSRDDDRGFTFRRDDDNTKVSKRKGSNDFVSKLREKVRESEDVDTDGASLQDYLSHYFQDSRTVRRAFSFDSEVAIKNANKLCDRFAQVVDDNDMTREEAHELKVVLDALIDFVIGIYKRREYNVFSRISLTLRQTRREVESMFWRTLNKSYAQYM